MAVPARKDWAQQGPTRKSAPETQRDQELVRRSYLGDTDAFKELVEKYRSRAFWIAYNMVHSREDSEDIAQEAFIRVYRSLHRFDMRRRFYTWLYQIVVNLSIDTLRKRGSDARVSIETAGEAASGQPGPEAEASRREKVDQVRAVVAQMPQKYQTIIVLRDIEGLSSKEIAEVLSCNHATVRWRLHRARGIFKEMWESRYGHG